MEKQAVLDAHKEVFFSKILPVFLTRVHDIKYALVKKNINTEILN